jgi:HAD superfamily hydrolase (TIGR01459 family)
MSIRLLNGLSDIAAQYDAMVCDLWGVVHNGARVHDEAARALTRFRAERGPVVLLTNAPRVPAMVQRQLEGFGVPPECYDVIVSSGGAVRADIAARAAGKRLHLYYIGTRNEHSLYEGLDIELAGLEDADVVLAAGLRDDLKEVPADYADELKTLAARGLTMLCANPDIVVHRGEILCWCAGSLARDYEKLGGQVVYYGKPHAPVYDLALAATGGARRVLAIGDAVHTDLAGANRRGLDALFITGGIHAKDVEPHTAAHLTEFLAARGGHAEAAMAALKW